ncbi:hypothetical protein [Amycolatopsis regifaucium]|uniref:hypothetical protein n=1 Tax=Amycolatopsis regifaucium TaxID=546365 RepID=UPI0008F68CBC|nr:hypothetical protein [Amycolatopsis regifaucium]SFI66332.1 hypothetical protein SAMN04489731_11295 [Amycolatopsis regifaucium]
MTSFPAAARRVRDTDLTPRDRLLSLRECVLCFAPYGFRATWHHLIVGADGPEGVDEGPLPLPRMVDELEEARFVWRAQVEDYVARRRREKAAGHRTPPRANRWRSWSGMLAYCPDFEKHPTDRLAVVVRRVIAAYDSGADPLVTCRACGQPLSADFPCLVCGVDPRPTANRPEFRTLLAHHRWRELWLRGRTRAAL